VYSRDTGRGNSREGGGFMPPSTRRAQQHHGPHPPSALPPCGDSAERIRGGRAHTQRGAATARRRP
jgi:hypothetical protein